LPFGELAGALLAKGDRFSFAELAGQLLLRLAVADGVEQGQSSPVTLYQRFGFSYQPRSK
ncbi:MAG: hypothetical protein RLZZ213_1013, partial [Cyanobacteriota bacterium]